MPPRASMMLVGGGLPEVSLDELRARSRLAPDFCDPSGLFRSMLGLTPQRAPRVVCVTSADETDPAALGEQHRRVLSACGAAVTVVGARDRLQDQNDRSAQRQIEAADIVLLCGGDQSLLDARFGGTAAWRALRDRFRNDPSFVLAGNSAGAMILGDQMIAGGDAEPGHAPSIRPGWGFLACMIDTHVGPRRRRRLGAAMRLVSAPVGLALATQSAVVYRNGVASVLNEPTLVVRSDSANSQLAETPLDGCEGYRDAHLSARLCPPGAALPASDLAAILDARG